MDDTIEITGFTAAPFASEGIEHLVYRGGTGPAVIVLHEIPGLHPGVIEFSQRLVARGFHVVMPSLFGTPKKAVSGGYIAQSLVSACVAKEFTNWALNQTSPVTKWLRALALDAHRANGGPGVGAIGMCFTGGFALGMMVDDRMLAPVLSQPSLPFAAGKKRSKSVGISNADLAIVKKRVEAGACVMGLRFSADKMVPDERFETLREELGEGFLAVEIDSSPDNPNKIPTKAHSVLTLDFVDSVGHPTYEALERVLEFLDDRLRV